MHRCSKYKIFLISRPRVGYLLLLQIVKEEMMPIQVQLDSLKISHCLIEGSIKRTCVYDTSKTGRQSIKDRPWQFCRSLKGWFNLSYQDVRVREEVLKRIHLSTPPQDAINKMHKAHGLGSYSLNSLRKAFSKYIVIYGNVFPESYFQYLFVVSQNPIMS